jgi:hypothetical protein
MSGLGGAPGLKHGGRAHHKGHHRARGGASEESVEEKDDAEDLKLGRASQKYNAVGSETEKEAMAGGYGGHKHGGRAKKAAGGPIALKRGGKVHHGSMPMMIEGKGAKHRLDRPGRKGGGAVGADTSPMTAASRLTAPPGVHNKTPDREDN